MLIQLASAQNSVYNKLHVESLSAPPSFSGERVHSVGQLSLRAAHSTTLARGIMITGGLMPRRYSSSQLKSKVRQVQRDIDRAVDKYNRSVKSFINQYNHAVNDYNREARAHNARVRSNRARLERALAKYRQSSSTRSSSTRYVTVRTSTETLHRSYITLEQQVRPVHRGAEDFLAWSEQETANSIAVMNALDGHPDDEQAVTEEELQATEITMELSALAPDLDSRWRGALFALNPRNPDAARHFCTSVREILTTILHLSATDVDVLQALPGTEVSQGRPTRRSRIRFLLHRKGLSGSASEEFVERDIDNIIALFNEFNSGTHGAAGKFDLAALAALKQRVEDGILFLANIAR